MSTDKTEEVAPVEEEYEVERIVEHKIIKTKKTTKFMYLIKWLNYDDSDNTWEKEANVFAIDLIANYWNNISKSDPDRVLFEELQSKKKNPIVLGSSPQPKVAKVISHASPSPPSSPQLKPVEPAVIAPVEPNSKISNMISSFFQPKKKETVSSTSPSSSSTTSPAIITAKEQTKLDQVYTPTTTSSTQVSVKGKEREDEVVPLTVSTEHVVDSEDVQMETPEDDKEYTAPTPTSDEEEKEEEKAIVIDDEEEEEGQVEEEEEEEGEIIERPNRPTLRKRTRSTYTDYFIEQHKKKRLSKRRDSSNDSNEEEEDDDDNSSVEQNKKKIDILKETDSVILDESYNADLDWNNLAKKIEYIGREIPGGPIYCLVLWKDDIRSLHSLDLVRKKRPDLVIDSFVELID